MTTPKNQSMSRRNFLKAAAVVGAGTALAACAPAATPGGGANAPAVHTVAKQTVR